ncbi:uncharacterized protein LOC142634587 [Castanea sativa]|uniref:uncharacterized protein LOC142634587 n=1 Tax=Castanea sativa TaxID=21020 RepID=UPI003F64BF13
MKLNKGLVLFLPKLRKVISEREIQTMVVFSLAIQIILIVMGYKRKVSNSNKIVLLLWVAYQLAGWFATVSLSIISNHFAPDTKDPKFSIAAFWAPFFLLHLAGPDTITAYSLEDNALWRRQALILVGQVGVTIFIIFRAWENELLNFLAVVMLIPGLIKIGERIWVLRSGSSENFKATTLRRPDPGPNYARFMEEYQLKKDEGLDVTLDTLIEARFVSDISLPMLKNCKIPDAAILQRAYVMFQTFKQIFSDLILSIQDIKNSQSYFQKVSFEEAFNVIEVELGFMYDVFYTKAFLVYSLKPGCFLRLTSFCSTLVVLLVFSTVGDNKHLYTLGDRVITYVLLCGAISLEIYSVLIILTSDWSMHWLSKHENATVDLLYRAISVISSIPFLAQKKRWRNKMGQYNLIKYCTECKPARCGLIQRFLFYHEMLEKNRYQELKEVSQDLKKLIFQHLLEKSRSAKDLKPCTELCACRGDRVLKKSKCSDCIRKEESKTQHEKVLKYSKCSNCIRKEESRIFHETVEEESDHVDKDAKCLNEINRKYRNILQESVEVEFDQSILQWHIATSLCYNVDQNTHQNTSCQNHSEASKLLSDYMLYLQVMRPIMLPNGIEQIRFQDTLAEAKIFFEERSVSDEIQASKKLLVVNTDIPPSVVKGDRSKSVLFDGCRLAKSLQCLEIDKKWELVSNVWIEMMCYAATKCRWNHHAQQLCRGGEFFTHVWLLMAHLGITEQFQISKGHARAMLVIQ